MGKKENITIILIIILGLVLGTFFIFKIQKEKSYNSFFTMASELAKAADEVRNSQTFYDESTVYLYDTYIHQKMNNLKNPFGKGNCDPYLSYSEYAKPSLITIQCGEYRIRKEAASSTNNAYQVYKIGEWKPLEGNEEEALKDNVEIGNFYTVFVDDEMVLDNYYPKRKAIELYAKKTKLQVYNEDQFDSNVKLVSKQYIRTEDLFKKITENN